MTQVDFGTINPATKNGTDLATDLNNFRTTLYSSHKGTGTPSYAVAGQIWNKDVSAAAQEINYYDGADNIKMFTVDTTNNRTLFYPYSLNFFTGSHIIISTSTQLQIKPNGTTTGQWYFDTAGLLVASDASNRGLIMTSDNAVIAPLSTTNTGFSISATGAIIGQQDTFAALYIQRRTNNGDAAIFYRNNAIVGSISVTTVATAYNTSSDYRLKYEIEPIVMFTVDDIEFDGVPDILKRILKWRPVTFKFKHDEDAVKQWGFIAHELQEFAPYAVNGEKDAVEIIGSAYRITSAVIAQNVTEAEAYESGYTAWEWDGVVPAVEPGFTLEAVSEEKARQQGCEEWAGNGTAIQSTSIDGTKMWIELGTGVKHDTVPTRRGVATIPERRTAVTDITEAEAISKQLVDFEKTGERPIYQGVDHSKLVPELAAALQSTLDLLLETRLEVKRLKALVEGK